MCISFHLPDSGLYVLSDCAFYRVFDRVTVKTINMVQAKPSYLSGIPIWAELLKAWLALTIG